MSHRVTLQPGNQAFTVEEGESVLDAALRQGLVIPYSCRGGSCGSCSATIVAGEVGYPDGPPPALSPAAEADGEALLCQARALSDLTVAVREVRQAAEAAPRRLPCRVARIDPLAPDVRRLYLRTPGKEPLPYLAGQYIDILLAGGRRRAFSLANAPREDGLLELHIRHVSGGEFTDHVFTGMREGELLRLEGPLGRFRLHEDSPRPILMLAGGTGFAPLKALLEQAFRDGATRPIHLFWGARAVADLYLDALPRRWAVEHSNFRYTPVLAQPDAQDRWTGATGLVHETLLRHYPSLLAYDVYMSGPPAMIRAAREAFLTRGLDPEHLYFDAFDLAPRLKPHKDEAPREEGLRG